MSQLTEVSTVDVYTYSTCSTPTSDNSEDQVRKRRSFVNDIFLSSGILSSLGTLNIPSTEEIGVLRSEVLINVTEVLHLFEVHNRGIWSQALLYSYTNFLHLFEVCYVVTGFVVVVVVVVLKL